MQFIKIQIYRYIPIYIDDVIIYGVILAKKRENGVLFQLAIFPY